MLMLLYIPSYIETEIMIQSSLVSASKCFQLSLSKSILFIFRTAQKCLKKKKKMCQNTGQTSGLFAGRESISEAEPLVGELHEARSAVESTSCTGRKQNQNRWGLTNPQTVRECCWNEVLWNHPSTHLVWRCGGYSSWCRYQTGCTRMQTWTSPEQQADKTSELHLQRPQKTIFFFFFFF